MSFVHLREKFDSTVMVAFVACGSEPNASEAERSGEGGFGGFSPIVIKNSQRGGGSQCSKRFVVVNFCSE
jgi:hypothetical protein